MSLNEPSSEVVLLNGDRNEIVMIVNLSLNEPSMEVLVFIGDRNEDSNETTEIGEDW